MVGRDSMLAKRMDSKTNSIPCWVVVNPGHYSTCCCMVYHNTFYRDVPTQLNGLLHTLGPPQFLKDKH